jgi:hypothetical protein
MDNDRMEPAEPVKQPLDGRHFRPVHMMFVRHVGHWRRYRDPIVLQRGRDGRLRDLNRVGMLLVIAMGESRR